MSREDCVVEASQDGRAYARGGSLVNPIEDYQHGTAEGNAFWRSYRMEKQLQEKVKKS